MHSERLGDGMTGPEADRILASNEAHERLQRAMRGRATPEMSAWLRAEAEALSPLVDQARAMRAPTDETDPDEMREAVRESRHDC